MDSHDVSRGRGSIESVLGKIEARTLIVGVTTDQLFPLSEQVFLHKHILKSDLGVIDSPFGHDAFLIEYDQLSCLIREFLDNDFQKYKPTILKTIKN
jgi:homoserine O-acetyltransferase